jgi:hypothetical protein
LPSSTDLIALSAAESEGAEVSPEFDNPSPGEGDVTSPEELIGRVSVGLPSSFCAQAQTEKQKYG